MLKHFRLFLGVLFIRRAPVNFNGDAIFGAKIAGCIVRTGVRRFKEWIALRFRNHSQRVGFLPESRWGHDCGEREYEEKHPIHFGLSFRSGMIMSQSQPARKLNPPIGVMAPNHFKFVTASK